MKTAIFLVLCSLSITLFAQKGKYFYLAQINKYNEASSFEDVRYKEMTWQQFYSLEETNELVDPLNYDFDLMNAACFFAVNKYRASKGIATLKFEPRMRDAASIHTDQMIRRNFFDHINQADATIRFPNNRTELNGFSGERIAENLARIYITMDKPMTYIQIADKAVKELSRSKEHNMHMIDSNLTLLGCALLFEASSKDGFWYYRLTQDFGKNW